MEGDKINLTVSTRLVTDSVFRRRPNIVPSIQGLAATTGIQSEIQQKKLILNIICRRKAFISGNFINSLIARVMYELRYQGYFVEEDSLFLYRLCKTPNRRRELAKRSKTARIQSPSQFSQSPIY